MPIRKQPIIPSTVAIFNEDCMETMRRLKEDSMMVDIILTSPPYNTGRPTTSESKRKNNEARYDMHLANMKGFGTLWLSIASIIERTNFTVADRIIWKKDSALPNNVSKNKLTRIVEDVFVICRKSEVSTFKMNKEVSSVSAKNGQTYYKNYFNFIEARNNDGSCLLNKATYSTELCYKLLSMYSTKGDICYDPFNGTGTTGVACKKLGIHYIGSEISKAQCEYSLNRLNL